MPVVCCYQVTKQKVPAASSTEIMWVYNLLYCTGLSCFFKYNIQLSKKGILKYYKMFLLLMNIYFSQLSSGLFFHSDFSQDVFFKLKVQYYVDNRGNHHFCIIVLIFIEKHIKKIMV